MDDIIDSIKQKHSKQDLKNMSHTEIMSEVMKEIETPVLRIEDPEETKQYISKPVVSPKKS
jgi:hypothetical protein